MKPPPQRHDVQKNIQVTPDSVNATQIYKAPEAWEEVMERHHAVKKEDAGQADKHWTETVQYIEEYSKWKLSFLSKMIKYESMWDGNLGRIILAKHRINLNPPNASPNHANSYQAGPRRRELDQREVRQMLIAGVAKPAVTKWASLFVFVSKKDGGIRFCVDYRCLIAVRERDSYPIPCKDKSIDSLEDAKVFSTLDARSGYWQIDIDEVDVDKTAFIAHDGLFKYKKCHLGSRMHKQHSNMPWMLYWLL